MVLRVGDRTFAPAGGRPGSRRTGRPGGLDP